MKIKVVVIIESEVNETSVTSEVACLTRDDLNAETLGLTLDEAKDLLTKVQSTMVEQQASEYLEQQRSCPNCGKSRANKGQHQITFRSLFGKLELTSPRLYTCGCEPQTTSSFSPLAEKLPERTAPELLYLQTKWASLMSYGLTVNLLEEVLPISTNVATVYREMHKARDA